MVHVNTPAETVKPASVPSTTAASQVRTARLEVKLNAVVRPNAKCGDVGPAGTQSVPVHVYRSVELMTHSSFAVNWALYEVVHVSRAVVVAKCSTADDGTQDAPSFVVSIVCMPGASARP